jgi:hypothetical protein
MALEAPEAEGAIRNRRTTSCNETIHLVLTLGTGPLEFTIPPVFSPRQLPKGGDHVNDKA